MNGCEAMQKGFSEYLDGRLNGREMQQIAAHLGGCRECAREWESLREAQLSLAELGPVAAPEDLLLRIRVAVSQERARSKESVFDAWGLVWKNTVGPFLLQASAGFASAVLLLGTVIVLVTMFTQPETAQANTDEPLGNPTAPRLVSFSSGVGSNAIGAVSGPVIVEVYIRCTTIASSQAPPTALPVPRWRTCSCSAGLSLRGTLASRSAALRCSPSPAFRCGDNAAFSF
jgi:hypothetical protein